MSPQTTKDSEGSSDSDDNCEPTKENTKKKIRKGCVVAIDKESEDSASDSSALSEQRWGRKNVEHSDIVVLPSNPSQAQWILCLNSSKSEGIRRKLFSKKPSLTLRDRFNLKGNIPRTSERSAPSKVVVNVPAIIVPKPVRKLVYLNTSRATTVWSSSKNATGPSKRAQKVLEAVSQRKVFLNTSSNVMQPSPRKILAQIKRHEESIKKTSVSVSFRWWM